MEIDDFEPDFEECGGRDPDPVEESAIADIEKFFNENAKEIFYSRQLEIKFEKKYYHWITNRAIRTLIGLGKIKCERRKIASGGEINLLWEKGFRYYRRSASKVLRMVEEYAAPNITASIGLQGEFMVLEGFARFQYLMKGRNINEYKNKKWAGSEHNLDFIFEKEGKGFGVEVKNTLGYMDHEEIKTKINIYEYLHPSLTRLDAKNPHNRL